MPENQQAQQQMASKVKQLEKQMQKLQQVTQQVQQSIEQVEETREGLGEISEGEQNAMSPIGAGVYMGSKLEDTDKVLVEIGADLVMEKETSDAINYLGDRKDKLLEAKKRYQEQLKKIKQQYQQIMGKARQMQQGQNVQ